MIIPYHTLWWTNIAIENGPVEIVDFLIENGDFPLQNVTVHQRVSQFWCFKWAWVNTYSHPFLVGWTSIYQLFWGSLGTRVLTHSQIWKKSSHQALRLCSGRLQLPWRPLLRALRREGLLLAAEASWASARKHRGFFDIKTTGELQGGAPVR